MIKNENKRGSLDRTVVIIPSLEPDKRLETYTNSLVKENFQQIIIVNDGSGATYDFIFKKIEETIGCIVLTHEKNRGKGAALKTAGKYIKQHLPQCEIIVTVDSDGQHTLKDVLKIAAGAQENKDAMILGCRDFAGRDIPLKSSFGNRISSLFFFLLYGTWLTDTQTGLRAFHRSLLDSLLEVPGERFEYEMQVLIHCKRSKIPLKNITIETIYEENNAGTHFRPILDSLKVMGVMFQGLTKFCFSSLLSSGVDLAIAWFLMSFFMATTTLSHWARIGIATVVARVFSIGINYLLNKNFVFHTLGNQKQLIRYLSLCILIMSLSAVSVYLVSHYIKIDEKIAKIICDCLLFFLSYQIQNCWVFRKDIKSNHEE